jgi:hypothetical protein
MAIIDPLTAVLDIGGRLIDRLWPDPAQRDAARLELLRMQQAGELAQIAVNVEEAKSASLFVSGWRPAIGWVCGVACAWNWLGLPMALFLASLLGHPVTGLKPADLSEMWPVLMGMLGLGALRTVEKLNDVARQ